MKGMNMIIKTAENVVQVTVNGQQVAQRRELRSYTDWGGMVWNVVDQSNICP
jgi:hypothetical protein